MIPNFIFLLRKKIWRCLGLWGIFLTIFIPHSGMAQQYSLRLGCVLEDLSKENLERIKAISHAFNYRFGIYLRIVIQKRQDLLLKLYQNNSVDFILTGLSQVLALEKSESPYKVILKSYKKDKSDAFVVLLVSPRNHTAVADPLPFPTERWLVGKSHIVLSEATASHSLLFPDISANSDRLVVKTIEYSPHFFKDHFTKLPNPVIVDLREFPHPQFGKVRSYRDISGIEKTCGCKVEKMSVPIPDQLILVNPAFYETRPLQTYQLMEFFLLIADDVQQSKNVQRLFKADGFVTATNSLITPFSYFLTRFKFPELANGNF